MYIHVCIQVSSGQGRYDVAQTWLMLKLLYCGEDPECSRLGLISTTLPASQLPQSIPPSHSTVGSTVTRLQVYLLEKNLQEKRLGDIGGLTRFGIAPALHIDMHASP